MNDPPAKEFGKRRAVVTPPAAPPFKRSRQVALLVMGTLAVGSGAYALMPHEDCTPTSPGAPPPQLSRTDPACPPGYSSSSGSHGGRWSHVNFFSSDSSSGRSSSGGSESSSGSVTRGGFGSFARAFSGHFSSGS